MSVDVNPSSVQTAFSPAKKHVPAAFRFGLIALLAIGFLPLLSWHLYGLLERPHYQFAILIPIAAWLLSIADPMEKKQGKSWKNPGLIFALTIFSLVGLGAATYYWSPWLAAVSFLLMLPCLFWLAGGMSLLSQWFRGWVLCWMMIPLPLGLDEDLIISLRTITTRLTSRVLDQFHVLHLQYGNVIEVPGKQLFIADACSGIHSLYVLLAAALFIGLWLGRGVVHIALMLCGAFALVFLENITRLFLIAFLLQHKIDLSSGLNHTILGAGLFAGSLFILMSLDQLILFFLFSERASAWENWRQKKKGKSSRGLGWGAATFFFASAVTASGLGIVQIVHSSAAVPDFASLSTADIELPEFTAQGLPETLNGFVQSDYKTVDRVPGDPFGQASQQWTYKKEGFTVLISIDYPYDGVHDFCVCYSNIGWTINKQKVLSIAEVQTLSPEESAPIAVGNLYRDLYGHGLLAFSSLDLKGQTTALIKELVERHSENPMKNRFGTESPNNEIRKQKLTPPYIQFQMLARSSQPLDAQSEQELLLLFIEARKRLTKMSLESLQ